MTCLFLQVPLKATILCIEEAVGFVEGPDNLKNFAAMKVQEIVFLEFSLFVSRTKISTKCKQR